LQTLSERCLLGTGTKTWPRLDSGVYKSPFVKSSVYELRRVLTRSSTLQYFTTDSLSGADSTVIPMRNGFELTPQLAL
jgi:hypothetical protein